MKIKKDVDTQIKAIHIPAFLFLKIDQLVYSKN